MKGIALGPDKELILTHDLAEPAPGPGEVKIKMLAGGVCGSDLAAIARSADCPSYPWTIGHEGGGVVVECAPDVTTLAAGDLVVIEPNYVCGKCYWCSLGQTKMCENRIVVSGHVPGIFAEYVTVPAEFAWKLPAGIPKSTLAAFEPAVVAHSAVERYLPTTARNVLVIGAGSQGLPVVHRLVTAGYSPAVSEPNEQNLARALEHGARDMRARPEEMFDLVFETSGTPAGFTTALERAEKMADICLIGQTTKPTPLALRPIVQKEITIRGHLTYNHPRDFAAAVEKIVQAPEEPVGLRPAVNPKQAVQDIQEARSLAGKIWIDLEDWD